MLIKNTCGSILAAIAAAFVLSVATASAQISAGSKVTGTIEQSLNSRYAGIGDPVTLDVTSASGNSDKLYGYVGGVVRAGEVQKGLIKIDFTRLDSWNGSSCAVTARVISTAFAPPT